MILLRVWSRVRRARCCASLCQCYESTSQGSRWPPQIAARRGDVDLARVVEHEPVDLLAAVVAARGAEAERLEEGLRVAAVLELGEGAASLGLGNPTTSIRGLLRCLATGTHSCTG